MKCSPSPWTCTKQQSDHGLPAESLVNIVKEHDRIVLTDDLPEHHLQAGDVGTVVHVYTMGDAQEVEFFTLEGHTLDVITVEAEQVSPVGSMDVLHARPMQ